MPIGDDAFPVDPVDVLGTRVPVTVDDQGIFTANYRGRRFADTTREGLRSRLLQDAASDDVEVAIAFTAIMGPGRPVAQNGVATGLEGDNGDVLVRWEGGTSEQIADSKDIGCYHLLNGEQAAEIIEMVNQQRILIGKIAEFDRLHGINLAQAVRVAVQQETAGIVGENCD